MKIIFLLLVFCITNIYANSWLGYVLINNHNTLVEQNNQKSVAPLSFLFSNLHNSYNNLTVKNHSNIIPSHESQWIGDAGDYKNIYISLDGKTSQDEGDYKYFGVLKDNGNYLISLQYHPVNYKNDGTIDTQNMMSDEVNTECYSMTVDAMHSVGVGISVFNFFYTLIYPYGQAMHDKQLLNPAFCPLIEASLPAEPVSIDTRDNLFFYNKKTTSTVILQNHQGIAYKILSIDFLNKKTDGLSLSYDTLNPDADRSHYIDYYADSTQTFTIKFQYTPPTELVNEMGIVEVKYVSTFDDTIYRTLDIPYYVNNTKKQP